VKICQVVVATFLLLAVAAAVPPAVGAADHPGYAGMAGLAGPLPFGIGGDNVLRLADKLGLSDDQVTQINGILSAAQTANRPTRDQLKANEQAFEASYNPAQYDANAVTAYLAQQTPLLQQLVVSAFQAQAKVLAVLTPSQLAQFNQLRAQSGAGWQTGHGRH